MDTYSNYFNFPEIEYEIDLNKNPDNNGFWNKAKPIPIGSPGPAGEPKVTIRGQHHHHDLYLAIHVDDNKPWAGKDRLTLCFESNAECGINRGKVLLRYDFIVCGNECQSLYSESYDNANSWIFICSPAPDYIQGALYQDEKLCYWEMVVKINFNFLKKMWKINPDSFGMYVQILDYIGKFKFIRYGFPEIAIGDKNVVDFIPASEQWARGCLVELPVVSRKPLWIIDKFVDQRKVA